MRTHHACWTTRVCYQQGVGAAPTGPSNNHPHRQQTALSTLQLYDKFYTNSRYTHLVPTLKAGVVGVAVVMDIGVDPTTVATDNRVIKGEKNSENRVLQKTQSLRFTNRTAAALRRRRGMRGVNVVNDVLVFWELRAGL